MQPNKEIKVYKPLVWVRVAFWPSIEVLYWEWSENNFKEKRASLSYIFFPLHGRNVPENMIKDFWEVKDAKKLAREWKISHLNENEKSRVNFLAENMQKTIGRDPTDTELDAMIYHVLHSEDKVKNSEFTCDYWHRHKMWETCTCFSVYKTFGMLFLDELRKMWFEIKHKSEITPEMQQAFLKKQKQN